MIITRTPFRISFVGGGSDIPEFYQKMPGAVISTSINKYMYISTHDFFDYDMIRIKYSHTETVKSVQDLKHPIVREVLKEFDISGAIEISSNADIPAGCGLGSSSSFTVGLIHNLVTKNGKFFRKDYLAQKACEIEIERLQEPIGKQDQYAASFGGLNVIRFHENGSVKVEPVHLSRKIQQEFESNLFMFYTGMQRSASEILADQQKALPEKERHSVLNNMVGCVDAFADALRYGELDAIGPILRKNWDLKIQLSPKISNSFIQEYYEKGIRSGASGGKLLGAGGGGFLLFYCEKKYQERLKAAMSPLRSLNFKFDSDGSKVLFVSDDQIL